MVYAKTSMLFSEESQRPGKWGTGVKARGPGAMPSGKTSRVAGLKNCSSHKAIEAAHRYIGKGKRQEYSSNKMYIEISNAIPEYWKCTLSH